MTILITCLDIAIGRREFKKMLRDDGEFDEMKTRHANVAVDQLEQARKAFLDGDIYLDFKRGGEPEDFLMGQQLQFAQILVEILQNRDWILMETSFCRASNSQCGGTPWATHRQRHFYALENRQRIY